MAKTALVTGATGLLGRQVVKGFQRQGWTVIGTGLTRANPPSILKVDVSSEAEIQKVLDDVKYITLSNKLVIVRLTVRTTEDQKS